MWWRVGWECVIASSKTGYRCPFVCAAATLTTSTESGGIPDCTAMEAELNKNVLTRWWTFMFSYRRWSLWLRIVNNWVWFMSQSKKFNLCLKERGKLHQSFSSAIYALFFNKFIALWHSFSLQSHCVWVFAFDCSLCTPEWAVAAENCCKQSETLDTVNYILPAIIRSESRDKGGGGWRRKRKMCYEGTT